MKSLLAVVTALLGMSAQDVENPQFKYWTGCKPGSWVKMKLEMSAGGKKVEGESTHKLLELKDDMAVIEVSGKSKVGEKEYPIPVQKQEIKAKEPPEKVKISAEGDEEIEVAGKKLKCHWYEYSSKQGEKESKGKAWLSKEIPGGSAKVEIGGADGGKSIVMTAVEWEKK
jgi:hypothetical protein